MIQFKSIIFFSYINMTLESIFGLKKKKKKKLKAKRLIMP